MSAPEPLVPAECTMAGNDWFPLHFDRLRKSKWWRRASDLARARNVMLWGEAYKQVPAGSMPDDDDDLAEAAGFGMDVEGFLAAKDEIMAPWVLCSDGRWYHPTVCEVVIEAWEKASDRRRAAALKKADQRAKVRGQPAPARRVPPATGDVPAKTPDVPGDTLEKPGDIDTHDMRGQDREDIPPVVPEGTPTAQVLAVRKADVEAIWLITPKRSRERSSKADLERSLTAAARRGKPPSEVQRGLEAYFASAGATKDGGEFVKGVHRMVEGDRWQTFIDAEPPLDQPGPASGDDWAKRIATFRQNAYWNRLEWGPPPGRPGCTLPAEVQRAHGFEPGPSEIGGAAA